MPKTELPCSGKTAFLPRLTACLRELCHQPCRPRHTPCIGTSSHEVHGGLHGARRPGHLRASSSSLVLLLQAQVGVPSRTCGAGHVGLPPRQQPLPGLGVDGARGRHRAGQTGLQRKQSGAGRNGDLPGLSFLAVWGAAQPASLAFSTVASPSVLMRLWLPAPGCAHVLDRRPPRPRAACSRPIRGSKALYKCDSREPHSTPAR